MIIVARKRDFYDVLGVQKNVSEKELKRAYRKKAMQYHPDRYKGDKTQGEEKFKELNEAYSILSDSQQRQRYDRFGHAGIGGVGASARGANPSDFFSSIFDNFDIGSIFGGGFGSTQRTRRQQQGPQRGENVVLDLSLSFEEAYSGVSKKVKMPFYKPCPNCMGTGGEPDKGMKTCTTCRGSGIQEVQHRSGMFIQISREPCTKCEGRGQVPEVRCKTCRGTGHSGQREEIKVTIPKGTDSGEAVRVQGKGRPSNTGGMPGDLIFRINLKEHDTFERNGLDVYMRLPVDYPTLILGGTIQVPVIGSKGEHTTIALKIPGRSNISDVVKRNRTGFTRKIRGNEVSGDSYFVLSLRIPKKITKTQKELLKKLQLEFNHKK